jgi:hypothetical protein
MGNVKERASNTAFWAARYGSNRHVSSPCLFISFKNISHSHAHSSRAVALCASCCHLPHRTSHPAPCCSPSSARSIPRRTPSVVVLRFIPRCARFSLLRDVPLPHARRGATWVLPTSPFHQKVVIATTRDYNKEML